MGFYFRGGGGGGEGCSRVCFHPPNRKFPSQRAMFPQVNAMKAEATKEMLCENNSAKHANWCKY